MHILFVLILAGMALTGNDGLPATQDTPAKSTESADEPLSGIPELRPSDLEIRGGGDSTRVPFELRGNNIHIEVRVNGQGPFRFVLDTGAPNILTPELARTLALDPEGAVSAKGTGKDVVRAGLVKVSSVEIGDLRMRDQVFLTLAFGPMSRRETKFDGVIGYPVFTRMVVGVDHESGTLQFVKPGTFVYSGSGTSVPIRFKENDAYVSGELDGIAGDFTIDTGSMHALDLVRPFWERHRLDRKYKARFSTVTGKGIGGVNHGMPVRAGRFRLGSVELPGLVAVLSEQRAGVYADDYVSGNVGMAVLGLFNLVFDYSRQRIIFERNSRPNELLAYDRSGMALDEVSDGFEVVDVVAGGPADAAGVVAGDQILAVNGSPAAHMTIASIRTKLRGPSGESVRLRVKSSRGESEVKLVLRDIL